MIHSARQRLSLFSLNISKGGFIHRFPAVYRLFRYVYFLSDRRWPSYLTFAAPPCGEANGNEISLLPRGVPFLLIACKSTHTSASIYQNTRVHLQRSSIHINERLPELVYPHLTPTMPTFCAPNFIATFVTSSTLHSCCLATYHRAQHEQDLQFAL